MLYMQQVLRKEEGYEKTLITGRWLDQFFLTEQWFDGIQAYWAVRRTRSSVETDLLGYFRSCEI